MKKFERTVATACFAAISFLFTHQSAAVQCLVHDSLMSMKTSRLLLLGEVHGTSQTPEFLARFVCNSLRTHSRVVVFLEWPVAEQAEMDKYLKSDGGREAQMKFIYGSYFWRESQIFDGRQSLSMFRFLDFARRLIKSGRSVNLIAFDSVSKDRDKLMAETVRSVYLSNPKAAIITYTGNFHNVLRLPPDLPDELRSNVSAPMGSYLIDLHPFSLDLRPIGGETYALTDGATQAVKVFSLPAFGTGGEEIGVPVNAHGRELLDGMFSGRIIIPKVSASIPAVFMLEAGRDLR